jgi:hypothetical protein
MRQLRRSHKKYLGRKVLGKLLALPHTHPLCALHKRLQGRTALQLHEIKHGLALLASYYLRNLVVPTLLTSIKLDKGTLP